MTHADTVVSAAASARDRIEPVLVGDPGSRIFVCRHVPQTPRHPARLVVLCYPLAHEYERCHRAVRQLAVALARAGLHVVRFDYRGTGDSDGEPEDVSLDALCEDANRAIAHGLRLSGASDVALFGVRAGATVAARVAAARTDVTDVVFWSAVTDGAALRQEWLELQHRFEAGMGFPASDDPPPEILGMPLSRALVDGLLAGPVACPFGERGSVRRALWLGEAVDGGWDEAMRRAGIAVTRSDTDVAVPWRQEPSEAVVPVPLLNEIVSWLSTSKA
ncbi:MAG: alpha/beta fold hydrolase [Betaproteobacteria bacterium]|nr:alpha/beta fold hydrolase [Betaproteobacteria bacterium]